MRLTCDTNTVSLLGWTPLPPPRFYPPFRPIPFAIAIHKSTCTTSRLVSMDHSLGSLSCFALFSLRDLRVINTIVATLSSSPALSLSFKFHFSRSPSLWSSMKLYGDVNRIPLLSALFLSKERNLRDFTSTQEANPFRYRTS